VNLAARGSSPIAIRRADPADAATIARHRVAMFREMGSIHPSQERALEEASVSCLAAALERGTYAGWIACPADAPDVVVGGAGVQIRPLLPRPDAAGTRLLVGNEGLIVNVYVERPRRREGIARLLIEAILSWARDAGIARLVLHPSSEGRPLYETLGFVPTHEMRYGGTLVQPRSEPQQQGG
jgi:GNAT superfamily N-acetyltransferase